MVGYILLPCAVCGLPNHKDHDCITDMKADSAEKEWEAIRLSNENAELKQAIQNKLEWISIKDRLPTEAGDYAIINTYRGKSVRFAAHWFGNRWGEFLAGDITHWAEFLPLPVYPPKT